MHVRVNWRKSRAWVRVRKAVRAAKFEQAHACWCCGHEEVQRAFERVWEARQAARSVR